MKTIDELGISQTTWKYDEESNEIICHLPNGLKYQIAVPYIHSDEETDANACLIAAAPELYECLRELIEMNGCCEDECKDCPYFPCEEKECEIIAKAKAALAKASGEEVK